MSETRKDIISSLIFFMIGIGVWISASLIQDPGLSEMGPSKFPEFISLCMIVLSITLFMKTGYNAYKQKKTGCSCDVDCSLGAGMIVKDEWRAAAIAVICLIYAVTFTQLGYFISTCLAITLICVLFREKRIWVYPLLYGVAVIIWFGFTYLLSIRLP